jgi:hypothetical protein
MRRPYLAHLDRVDGVRCYLVDGAFVRTRIDVDFTNGAHHWTRRYVPRDEVWVDRDAPGADEHPFWVAHQLLERELMLAGIDYLRALARANRAERLARRAALRQRSRGLDEARLRVRQQRLGRLDSGDDVWIVSGRGVRDHFDPNFTQGGHGLRYRFIPRREIWIDDAIAERELDPTLAHEAHELELMREGMAYYPAHDRALALEREVRLSLARTQRAYGRVPKRSSRGKLCNPRFTSY